MMNMNIEEEINQFNKPLIALKLLAIKLNLSISETIKQLLITYGEESLSNDVCLTRCIEKLIVLIDEEDHVLNMLDVQHGDNGEW